MSRVYATIKLELAPWWIKLRQVGFFLVGIGFESPRLNPWGFLLFRGSLFIALPGKAR
jgi:hypothetical protein